MKAIILAAGIGSRLGNLDPKPLTKLSNGELILQRQINYLSEYIGINNIYIIVGYKKDVIIEAFPKLVYIYNNFYDITNTSKSLFLDLELSIQNGMKFIPNDISNYLWMEIDFLEDLSNINNQLK